MHAMPRMGTLLTAAVPKRNCSFGVCRVRSCTLSQYAFVVRLRHIPFCVVTCKAQGAYVAHARQLVLITYRALPLVPEMPRVPRCYFLVALRS